MIETVENAIQIAVLLVCAGVSLYLALTRRNQTWTVAFFLYGSWFLGDLYWQVCLMIFGETPQISVVSDLSWYASYIFLYLLLSRTAPPEECGKIGILPWLGPVFSVGMAVFFMLRGEILSNLIYAGLMGLLLFSAIRRLVCRPQFRNQTFLSVLILVFCLLEYGLWTSSCFFESDSLANPYYWFDFLISLSFVFFLPATGKAVKR